MDTLIFHARSVLEVEVTEEGTLGNTLSSSFALDGIPKGLIEIFIKDNAFTLPGCQTFMMATIAGLASCIHAMAESGFGKPEELLAKVCADLYRRMQQKGKFKMGAQTIPMIPSTGHGPN